MATVRISGYLKDTVQDNIDKIFNKRIEKARENYNKKWGQRIVDNLYPTQLQTALNAIDNDWFNMCESLTLNGFFNAKFSEDYTHPMVFGNDSIKPYRRPEEYENCDIEGMTFNYSGDVELDGSNPKWDWIKAEFVKYNETIIGLKNQCNSYKEKVLSILNAYRTLAPCLKVWQDLYDLLPSDIQERHKHITEKRTVTKAEELNIDTDSLTSTLITSKLTDNE